MTIELDALIAKLEGASAPDRSLFEEAYEAAWGRPCWDDGERGERFQRFLDAEAWTDAAMSLVPEEMLTDLLRCLPGEGRVMWAGFNRGHARKMVESVAPALVLAGERRGLERAVAVAKRRRDELQAAHAKDPDNLALDARRIEAFGTYEELLALGRPA